MNNTHSTKPLNCLLLVSICAAGLTLSACSGLGAKPEKLSDAKFCENLNSLIADHPKQFSQYKKKMATHNRLNIWSATKLFPTAKTCQVWEWSTGLYNYVCDWSTGSDEAQAANNYQTGEDAIKSCLGSAWTATTTTTQSGGKHTLYSMPNNPTIVSIRYFKEQGGWSKSWQNTLVIGDKSNLNSPMQ
ncbi:MAG: hypothetical protein NTV43_03875 [Methylococcales bacterium]|nr:hypothetical protein [Methylococcales bacterium]